MNRRQFKLPDSIKLRDYQTRAVDIAIRLSNGFPSIWHLFSSPTGTGKSLIELKLLECIPDSILITPRLEIVAGMLQKLNHDTEDMSDNELVELSKQYGIITPIRLRNILAKGDLGFYPSLLIVDECHHDLAASYQDIQMYLNGVPKCGFTATPYRGTPRATQEFHRQWNDTINICLTLSDAIAQGYCALPTSTIWPLLDDDLISIQNGEFKLQSTEKAACDQVQMLASLCKLFYCNRSRLWDRPTMFSVPTTRAAFELTNALNNIGLPAERVTQETPRKLRSNIFTKVVNHQSALVQIDVISEGVDLPIRRLIDLKPTLSPVRWVQQIGRIMRPSTVPPEYICCCRNLERHAYLMEGMLPSSAVKEAQEAFGRPSTRSGTRAVGLEGLGKFKQTPIQLLNGETIFTYHLVHVDGFKRSEYFTIVHPNHPEPVHGMKESVKDSNNEMKWGKWKLVERLPDLRGCQTAKDYPLTEKQLALWNNKAESFGINPHKTIETREFQLLPFLMNTGLNFRRK